MFLFWVDFCSVQRVPRLLHGWEMVAELGGCEDSFWWKATLHRAIKLVSWHLVKRRKSFLLRLNGSELDKQEMKLEDGN